MDAVRRVPSAWQWRAGPPASLGEALRAGAALGVFVLALVPRLVGVGTFLTADEKNWMGRGVEFVRALKDFRFNDTLQTTHPGIPTLWIAGLTATAVSAVTDRQFSFDEIRRFTTPAQVVFALVNSALIALTFFALRGLVPERLALLAAAVMALDPFLVAHGRLIHVDALLTSFTILALLLLLRARFLPSSDASGARSPLVWSAIVAALALLSKVPGLLVLPVAVGVLWVFPWPRSVAERRARLVVVAQWLAVFGVVVLLLWPGLLWVPDPVGNVKIVKRDVTIALSTPHNAGNEDTERPNHYLRTIVARSTIPTLLGGLTTLVLLLASWTRIRARVRVALESVAPAPALAVLTILTLFGAIFLLGMTLGAKKGDRYLLPVFPLLDILAVVGLTTFVGLLRPRWSPARSAGIVALLILVPLFGELVRLGPYALAHYNPLVRPQFSQELGWGEGLDQVAVFLNDQSNDASVASWYPEELRAYVRRPVLHLNAHQRIPVGYVVLYRNMFGRPGGNPANDFLDEYFRRQEPVFTATVNNLPYAWVYRRPIFSGTIGELVPGTVVVSTLPAGPGTLSGVEVFLATYSKRASVGELVAAVRRSPGGDTLRTARVAIRPEDDNRWVRLPIEPLPLDRVTELTIVLTATGTRAGNAPTIRTAPLEQRAPPYWVGRGGPSPDRLVASGRARGRFGLRAILESP